ncbi:polysaccharide deacetylase family protein [Candidatus Desantisbacteria bacterium]|nr:polysaccharide deacetylase family protein [Candidatus Desantisbacteria bacterium]
MKLLKLTGNGKGWRLFIMNYNNYVPILTYHRVVPIKPSVPGHGIWVLVDKFRQQMRLLHLMGFNTISLDMLASGDNFPRKPIIISFDDGYQDNYLYAFPILKQYGFTATIFLVSGQISGVNQWDILRGEEPLPLVSIDEIQEMAKYGISFGGHTVTHPHLSQLDRDKAFEEIVQCKKELEEIVKQEVTAFCYPYGEFDHEVKQMVKNAGFKCACACDTEIDDLYELRRIQVFPKTDLFGFWRKTRWWYKRAWFKL